jgi:ATP-dependent DNA helicase PIF1
VQKICLTRNMRAQSDPWFLDYLLRIGNETKDTFADDYVCLPNDIFTEYRIDCVP